MLGQHMLKRLHARSDWKNLYICGDSTVMATGAPAAVVSGVGAANVILRDMKKQDYDSRKFEKSYINFVDLPFTRPEFKAWPADNPRNMPGWQLPSASGASIPPAAAIARPGSISRASCAAWKQEMSLGLPA